MDIKSVINKKRNRRELDRDEIKYFVGKYAKGEITEAQAARKARHTKEFKNIVEKNNKIRQQKKEE